MYSPDARRDLDKIWDYVAEDLQNISAAERIVTEILNAVDRLAEFPEMGVRLSSIANIESDYRFLVKEDHLTFYRVYGSDIYVDRILRG